MKRLLSIAALAVAVTASGVTVEVDPDCEGMGTVAWASKALANGTVRLTLKATAEDGCAFAGWSVAERDIVAWTDDLRYPGSLTATVVSNAAVTATFAASEEDCLSFDISNLLSEELEYGTVFSEVLDVDSRSFPEITFKNLPTGLSYDARTLTLFGTATEPGVYRVEADAVNGSGFTFRSCCTVRVMNYDSARMAGDDTEIPLDEYWYAEPQDLFFFSEDPSSLTLKANVPGLTWKDGWQLLYGTPTKIGDYTLEATAHFPTGRVEKATMTLSVIGADPEEYDLDFDALEELQVGDTFEEETEIGVESSDVRIRSVTGLPTGLAVTTRYADGARRWYVSGTVREPGFFDVTAQVEDRSDVTQRVVTVCRTVTVTDLPDVYLSATSADESRGTVSGGGAVSPAADVTLTASARSGFVFSGWYDAEGERLVLLDGVDYRTPSVRLPAGTDFSFLAPIAHFEAKADDAAPDLYDIEDADYSFSPTERFETTFVVESASLPTLTFKGLPTGMTCSATGDGSFALTYDPSSGVATSGRLTATVTAVNASGRKSSATFRVTVEAYADERIRVYEDYGEFAPDEEIDPIDLSNAVDFSRGETLSVSGLPKGLKYNEKANAKNGVAAHTITGTPTAPGDYTLKFAAKVVSGATTNKSGKVTYSYEKASATSFLTVLPFPALEIEVDEEAGAAGCTVKGAGSYRAGTKVTLQATAGKGWVFAGWDGLDDIEGLAALNPKLTYVAGEDDVWVLANFVPVSEDSLEIDSPAPLASGFAAAWPLKEELDEFDAALIADLIGTVSWPTVKVEGLPAGVKFSSSTFLLSGKPTKSGVFHVTVSAKNAGGYSFVRVFDIAVLEKDGSLPTETPLANAAEIDFTPLEDLTTGVFCPTGAVVLAVGPKPNVGTRVSKVAVSGLPPGLSATATIVGYGATVEVTGTPTKPGRQTVTVSVTYADGKTLKSQAAVVVADGGSRYLSVTVSDADGGTVSGTGVYASGATVKLTAKAASQHVFAGWRASDEEGELALFAPLGARDGIDPRTATVSFPFRPSDFAGEIALVGTFATSAEDEAAVIDLESDVWAIDPAKASEFAFAVDSLSLPKVTTAGLPKGVTVDAARGVMTYAPTAATVPGVYAATLSAKNQTQKKATAETFEIRVANHTSEEIGGLDPDPDAYPLTVGAAVDPSLIAPEVDDGWTLTAKGLPSGLTFKNGVVTGAPTKTGNFTVTFTATTGKGASKQTETATITLRVAALPTTLCGTFTGVLTDGEDAVTGSFSLSATSAGKVSVAIRTPARDVTFSVKAWDALTEGVATVRATEKRGATLDLSVDSGADWTAWQASGSVALDGATYRLTAQRNSYGEKDGDADAREAAATLAGTTKLDGWTLKLTDKGNVKISGKYEGKSVSASSVLQVEDGQFFARYVQIEKKKSIRTFVFELDEDGQLVRWSVE